MTAASIARRLGVPGEPSFLSTPTGSGMRLFVHTKVVKSGALACVSVLTDGAEIHEANANETSRRRLREEFDRARREMRVGIASVSGEYVAARIRAAFKACADGPKGVSASHAKALAALGDEGDACAHPALALGPVDDADVRVARSLELHTEPEVNPILPTADEVERVGSAVSLAGRDADDPDATVEALRDAIDAVCGVAARARLAEQLRDVALVLAATRRVERALDAVATAAAIEDPATSVGRVPYVFGLFYKFALVQQELRRAPTETP